MLAQQLVNGVLLGAVYALFALGFTLMFGVLKVINLTYGFYFTIGAYLALFASPFGLWIALTLAAIGSGCIATIIDALLLTRLRRKGAPELASLMVTLGAVLALNAAMTAFFGADIRRLPVALIPEAAFTFGPIRVTAAQLLILGATVVLVVALLCIIHLTRLGLAIRALASQPDAAGLMGINAARTAAIVSFLSGSLAGAGGVLIGLSSNAIQPYMGEQMLLRGFVVIIVGGLGDIPGALMAGLILGMVEVLTAGYVASELKDAVGFLILVLVLWTKPLGLFGRATIRRA
jgi:branched-chain amino acid transport system permease protein